MMKKNLLSKLLSALMLLLVLLDGPSAIAGITSKSISFPITVNSISVVRNRDKTVAVNWIVDREIGTRQYELERSLDGTHFSTVEIISTTTNDGEKAYYNQIDWNAPNKETFYRIKAVSLTGKAHYSAMVKVALVKEVAPIGIYPNPVMGKALHVHFVNQPDGEYRLVLFNKLGQAIFKSTAIVDNNNDVRTFQLPSNTPVGSYQLSITTPANTKTTEQVLIN